MTFLINWASLWVKGFRYFISFNPHNNPMRKGYYLYFINEETEALNNWITQGHTTNEQKRQHLNLGPRVLGHPRTPRSPRSHREGRESTSPAFCSWGWLSMTRRRNSRQVGRAESLTSSSNYVTLHKGESAFSLSKTAIAEVWIWF